MAVTSGGGGSGVPCRNGFPSHRRFPTSSLSRFVATLSATPNDSSITTGKGTIRLLPLSRQSLRAGFFTRAEQAPKTLRLQPLREMCQSEPQGPKPDSVIAAEPARVNSCPSRCGIRHHPAVVSRALKGHGFSRAEEGYIRKAPELMTNVIGSGLFPGRAFRCG